MTQEIEPRDFNVEERRTRFLRWKSAQPAASSAGNARQVGAFCHQFDADEPRMLEEIEGLR